MIDLFGPRDPLKKPPIMTNQTHPAEAAFTRADLLATLTALGLIVVTVWPMLAEGRKASEQAACASNLERVGQAWQSWITENGAPFPWQRSASAGGLGSTRQVQNTFRSFQYLSNHLASPEYLVCPADTETVMRATNWAVFDTSYYRGNALSYTVGTDSFPNMPEAMLSSDRHFVGTRRELCVVGSWTLALYWNDLTVAWNTNAIHGESGNLLKVDGSVLPCSGTGLREYLMNPATDANGNHHFLPPR